MRSMYEIYQRIHRIRIKFLQHFTLRGLQESLRIECKYAVECFTAQKKMYLTLHQCYELLV